MPLLLALALQTTPVPPVVKGTALPPPAAEEAAVLAPITALFAGIAARDSAQIAPLLLDGGGITVATEGADGAATLRRAPWAQFLSRITPGPERHEERMPRPAIEIDGDIAMVWGDYTFLLDGKVHHCGVNHFSMARDKGVWKIADVAWSSRSTGCAGQ